MRRKSKHREDEDQQPMIKSLGVEHDFPSLLPLYFAGQPQQKNAFKSPLSGEGNNTREMKQWKRLPSCLFWPVESSDSFPSVYCSSVVFPCPDSLVSVLFVSSVCSFHSSQNKDFSLKQKEGDRNCGLETQTNILCLSLFTDWLDFSLLSSLDCKSLDCKSLDWNEVKEEVDRTWRKKESDRL